jgi:hypothetical protein
MCHLLDVHPEAHGLKQPLGHGRGISKGMGAHHRTRRLIGDTKDQMPATLIGQRHAVLV